ncbi:hypothetical protein [Corynebacterium variabile]
MDAVPPRPHAKEDTVDSWWGRVPAFAMRHAKVLAVGLVGVLLLLTPSRWAA